MKLCTPRLAVACLFLCLMALPGSLRADTETEHLIEGAHWKKAKALVEARIKANPNDPSALYDLLRVDLAFDDLEQAEHAGERAVELNGADADYHAQLATVYATAAEHASVLKQVVLVHKMRHEMEAALAIDSKNVNALLVEASFDWQAPVLIGGSREKALAVVDRLRLISPLWGNLLEARFFQSEDRNRTEAALRAAASATPRSYRARVLLADFYASTSNAQKQQEAERIAKESLGEDPDRVGAYNTLAKIYAEQDRMDDLDALLARAETKVPDDLSPFYFAAKALLDRDHDAERCESYLRKYLSQPREASEPEPSAARTLLAVAIEHTSPKFEQSAPTPTSAAGVGGVK